MIWQSSYLKCTTYFLFARLNLPNVLISIAKQIFSIAIFLPHVLMYQKCQITSGEVQNRETQNRTLGTIVTSFQNSKPHKKTDFSVIFLLWANQLAKEWYNSALFMRTWENAREICFLPTVDSRRNGNLLMKSAIHVFLFSKLTFHIFE